MAKCETGTQLLARLGARPSLASLEPSLFAAGPQCGEVYEFYGGEGTGKTEVLLHLVTNCILPKSWNNLELDGKDTGVVLVDTEIRFPVLRLAMVMEYRIKTSQSNSCDQPAIEGSTEHVLQTDEEIENFIQTCLRKLHIYQCVNSFQMLVTLHSLETLLSNNPNVSLLIVDTVSAYYWMDKSGMMDSQKAQDKAMKPIIDILRNYTLHYNMVLIATKSALFHKIAGKGLQEQGDISSPVPDVGIVGKGCNNTSEYVEFLGKSWTKFVTRRFVFTKSFCGLSSGAPSFTVQFQDSESQKRSVIFMITDSGVMFNT